MLNPLRKRYKREIKNHADRYLAIFIIFAVMVMIISGFLVMAEGVRDGVEQDHLKNQIEDGQFVAKQQIQITLLADAEELGVTIVKNYYADAELASGQTIRIYENRSEMNLPSLWEGKLPERPGEIALDRLFAEKNDFQVGDIFETAECSLEVVGLISVPDYSSLFKKNTDLMMDAYDFGICITPSLTLDEWYAEDITYSYSYRYANRDLTDGEQKDLSDDLKAYLVEQQIPLSAFLMAQENQSISFLLDDMGSDIPMMKLFLYIIQVIMAFVFTVIISSTVEEEAAVIGTLFASGYKKYELVRHYLMLPVWVTLSGAIVGNILTYTVGTKLYYGLYYGSYSLPPTQPGFYLEAFMLTTILPVVMIFVINALMLCFKLSLSPLKYLRRDLKRTKQKRAIRLPKVSFLQRFRLRVILQNKGNYIMLFFGMLFASFILLFGLTMKPMIRNYQEQIAEKAVSNYQYIIKMPYQVDVDDAEAFSLQSLEIFFERADKNLEITFYGVAEDSAYWNLEVADLAKNEVIISEQLGKKIGVGIGDTLTFTDAYGQKSYQLTVAGLKEYPAGFAAFMERSSLNHMVGKPDEHVSGYLSNTPLTIPEEYIAATITPEDLADAGEQMLATFGQMSSICLGAALVIYFVVIYILTKIVVDKNTQSISFMKVMGYQDKEIKKLYLSATTLAVVVALLISLPIICNVLKWAFLLIFVRMNGYLEPFIPIHLLGLVALFGFIVYLAVNFLHLKRVQKIEMAEVLKNRE